MGEQVAERAASAVEPVSMFERLAKDPTVDVVKLKELVLLQERGQARAAEAEFNGALAQMQAELPVVGERGGIKDRSGNVQSTYALWEDVNRAILPVLRSHGFSLTFRQEQTDKGICVTGVLAHRSGHSERTSITLPADTSGSKNSVQAVGSSVSYGKRYTAGMLLNLTSCGEDDDGHKGGSAVPMSEEHAATIDSLCSEINKTMLNKVLGSYKAQTLGDIPDSEYETIVKRLNAARRPA